MKKRLSSLVAAACFAGALGILWSCRGDTSGPRYGTLSGRVTSQGNEGVPGAVLTLGPVSGLPAATSDSLGEYLFDSLVGGEYQLTVQLPLGYIGPANARRFVADSSLRIAGRVRRDISVAAILQDSARVPAGMTDSLVLKGGTVVTVGATGGAVNITASVVPRPTGSQGQTVLAPTVRLTFGSTGAGSSGVPARSSSSGTVADVSVAVTTAAMSRPETFLVTLLGATLWADASGTTVVVDGLTRTVPLVSLQVDPSAVNSLDITLLDAYQDCAEPKQTLRPVDASPLNGRIPLVLIHGWQPGMIDCAAWHAYQPTDDPFSNLIAKVAQNPDIASHYKTYLFRYATFEQVIVASEALYNLLQSDGLDHPVLVGHSMGGLVGRAVMVSHGSDLVRGLITLSTPHAGTPLADMVQGQLSGSGSPSWEPWLVCSNLARDVITLGGAAGMLPWTHGLADLRTNSDLVQQLSQSSAQPSDKVFTLGGSTTGTLNCLLDQASGGLPNDEVVTVSSSLPAWSALQLRKDGYNHGQMASGLATDGSDDPLFANVRSILSSLATCAPAPPIPAANDFPLSGSVVRTGGRSVQAVVNPILEAGQVVTGLGKANIQVIEDGCVQDFTFSTATGNIPVDVAFIQDVSGSMSSAIGGVRSSVITFAQQLQSMGVDAKLGSVGFSGNGTIPSTPGNAPQEYLGPVQDFTTPVPFQQFVAGSWTATGGGDLPENDLEAIEYAFQHLSWRPAASHVYILITDASMHQTGDSCDGLGACTDETVASITDLLRGNAVVHVVASSSQVSRTVDGGADPWLLADATGGQKLALGAGGSVDLTTLGIANVIGQVMRLTFSSSSDEIAQHSIRIRVTLPDGKVAELAPGLIPYAPPSRP